MSFTRTPRTRHGLARALAYGTIAAVMMLSVTVIAGAGEPPATGPTDPLIQVPGPAPVFGVDEPDAIKERYIVVFKKGAPQVAVVAAREQVRVDGGVVHFEYSNALKGFAATLSPGSLESLRHHPMVEFIDADRRVELKTTQSPATWGLDRIDQRNLPLNNAYTYDYTGSGVKAYVIDTGILTTHNEFGGRATGGYTAISDGRGTTDCNGHGTHVSGTVGGATYGVAKSVSLVAVRVLDCAGSGTNSGVIAGVDWVTGNHAAGQAAVANMSLGGGASSSLDTAVNNSINDGVTYAIAAGNSNANACNYSPARVAAAITVGATTNTDARASFSNYGTCLDIFAPGNNITSAWYTSNTATNTISGTSMAAPHVAGAAALYLQANPSASPASVRQAMVDSATSGVVTSPGTGSPNKLLYSLFGAAPPPPPPPPPPTGCGLAESYSGSLTGTGDYDYHPNGTYWNAPSGTHRGCLRGPTGTDFDLYLWKWNGWFWVTVAQGISSSSSEDVTYTGTSGYYVWRVESYSGSGTYTFGMTRP